MLKNCKNVTPLLPISVGGMGLTPVEYCRQRILTTKQLAEVYETSEDSIKVNFNNNKKHFTEGIHFHYLKGEDLKAFKNLVNDIYLVDKRAPSLYLWTERGASRHCKILDTDKAWEQFDNLEETYFRAKQVETIPAQLPAAPIQTDSALTERLDRLIGLFERQLLQPQTVDTILPTRAPALRAEVKENPRTKYDMAELKQKRLLTKAEAAFYICVGTTTFTDIINSDGFYPLIRIGHNRGKVFINREKLDQWLDERDGRKVSIRA